MAIKLSSPTQSLKYRRKLASLEAGTGSLPATASIRAAHCLRASRRESAEIAELAMEMLRNVLRISKPLGR